MVGQAAASCTCTCLPDRGSLPAAPSQERQTTDCNQSDAGRLGNHELSIGIDPDVRDRGFKGADRKYIVELDTEKETGDVRVRGFAGYINGYR